MKCRVVKKIIWSDTLGQYYTRYIPEYRFCFLWQSFIYGLYSTYSFAEEKYAVEFCEKEIKIETEQKKIKKLGKCSTKVVWKSY